MIQKYFGILITVLLLGTQSLLAQKKIEVHDAPMSFDGLSRHGMAVQIDLADKEIIKKWEKRLKEFGKLESGKSGYTVNGANIPGLGKPANIYSIVTSNGTGIKIWWAIDLGSHYVTITHLADHATCKNVLHDFAVQMYRDDVNRQISDAERALATSTKNQEKTISTGATLSKNIENNAQEKIDLELKLKENAEELVELKKAKEQNVLDQQKAAEEVATMQKALEAVKSKMSALPK